MLEALARLEPSAREARRLGLDAPLDLHRVWPRSDDHLLLEYRDAANRLVPGQWRRDPADLERVARQTTRRCPDGASLVTRTSVGGVLLQTRGADRRLPALASLVAGPGTTLLAHRPERRAMVRIDADDGCRFVKVVRPARVHAAADPLAHVATGDGRPFAAPQLLDVDETAGTIGLSVVPGNTLHETLHEVDFGRLAPAVVESLDWLHGIGPWPGVVEHDAGAEIALLERRVAQLRVYGVGPAREARAALGPVQAALAEGSSPTVTLHRDFHDKQVLVGPGNAIGLVDFDTLGRGEAALDYANFITHLEVRALQDRWPLASARAAIGMVLEHLPAEVVEGPRLPAYLDATRLRLACLYALRPRWAGIPERLLAGIGTTPSR